jgi:Ni/Fe-hydrogenase subunit HybB-like protein
VRSAPVVKISTRAVVRKTWAEHNLPIFPGALCFLMGLALVLASTRTHEQEQQAQFEDKHSGYKKLMNLRMSSKENEVVTGKSILIELNARVLHRKKSFFMLF